MKKLLKVICFCLCAPLILLAFLTGCNNNSAITTETNEDSNEDSQNSNVNEPDSKIDLSGDLISNWNFCGETNSERLADKATGGTTLESIALKGTGTEVRYGNLRINDGIGNYAVIGNGEGADLYDLSNKTIVFKAKISNLGNTLISGIISKQNSFDLYFENGSVGRTITFNYRVNGVGYSEKSSSSTPTDEWRVFAISFEVDQTSKKANICVYRSRTEYPSSGVGMEKVLNIKIDDVNNDFLKGSEPIYLGKRYDHINSERQMNSEFLGIKVYKTVLTAEEIVAVPFDMNKDEMLGKVNSLIMEGENIERTIQSDIEWSMLQNAINKCRALNDSNDLQEIKEACDVLETLISDMMIRKVSENIGDLFKIKYNNPDIVTPIYASYWSCPGFFDIDHDGKMDLILTGDGRTYSGYNGGGMYVYRNRSIIRGDVVFENAEILQVGNTGHPTYSYRKDGSSVFVTNDGTMYTDLSNQGFGEGKTFSKLKTAFKLYDIDGDGISDAVFIVTNTTGEKKYDSNGNWLQEYTSQIKWIKNTGSEQNPRFTSDINYLLDENNEIFTVRGVYPFFNSFSMYDWDNDGDIDLIAGGLQNEFYYYENVGTKNQPKFKSVGIKVETEGGPMSLDCCRYNVINYDWDGDGKDDLVMGSDSGDAIYFRFTGRFNSSTGAPIFENQKNFSTKAEYLSVSSLSRPTVCDFDGDGDIDFIVGESGGFLYYIENLTGGTNPKWAAPVKLTDENGKVLVIKAGLSESLQGAGEAEWGYTVPVACDWDGDGDIDIIANSVTGRIVWFENIGTATQPQLTQPKPVMVEWEDENLYPSAQWWKPVGQELVTEHRTTPYAIDLNGDGLCDLVMLDHEGYLAFYERYEEDGVLKLKQGKRIFLDLAGNPIKLSLALGDNRYGTTTEGAIGRVKLAITDWDGDGMLDVIVGSGVDMGNNFMWYKTTKVENGNYYLARQGELSISNINGHHPGFTICDWNNDGKPDIITGTESGYLYYFENKAN